MAGRRRPSGLWVGGFRCCLAIGAIVGLAILGVGGSRLHIDEHLSFSVDHRVAVTTPIIRPTPADDEAVAADLMLLGLALLGFARASRPTRALARSGPDLPSGRAPPTTLLHL